MYKLSKITRILLGVTSLSLIATYFVPLWQILLWAPQYPEGLTMKIWVNKLSGEVDIINGLNHYIGMKHISVEMFPEFQFLGLLIGLLIAVGVLAAILGNARILFFFTLLSYLYGVAAMWDFWRWGYDYGHNLDPNAAIKVPDMSYQPPLIGYKNLLNFTSFSGPDTGAWMIIGVCLLATILWWREYFKNKKTLAARATTTRAGNMMLVLLATLLTGSCTSGPEPIRYGQDACHHCKMILMDKRFGSEIITDKGKVLKFDDLNCLVAYLDGGEIPTTSIGQIVVVDFRNSASFIDVQRAYFLQNDAVKSPMRSDVAAFSDPAILTDVKSKLGGGKEMNWEEVRENFKK